MKLGIIVGAATILRRALWPRWSSSPCRMRVRTSNFFKSLINSV
jgi:hypothetical protein